MSNLAMWMTSDWRGVCNLRKSNRWWQKGRVAKKWEEGKKDLLVVTRLGSLAEAMEARGVGSCRIGKSTICSTA